MAATEIKRGFLPVGVLQRVVSDAVVHLAGEQHILLPIACLGMRSLIREPRKDSEG